MNPPPSAAAPLAQAPLKDVMDVLPGASPRPLPAPPAVSVRDLAKRYRLEKVRAGAPHSALLAPLTRLLGRGRADEAAPDFWALDGVTFDVARGERLAIIGPNGAGKSTLLKILARIVTPTRGEARIRGRLTSLLEVGVGFDNKLTGRENVFVNASMHGLSKRETAERFQDIVEFAGIDPKFIDMRVKHYSSGMRVRLAFSVAAHLDPDILLLDEVLSVGDAAFQEKCLERVDGMVKEERTLLFVSHSMPSVTRFCSRAIWLERGRVVMEGRATEVAAAYTEKARQAVAGRRWTRPAPPIPAPPADAAPEPEIRPRAVEDRQDELGADGTVQEAHAAELVSACVIDERREEIKAATADQRIGIEIAYDVLEPGKVVLPSAKFFTDDDVQMFSAVYTDPARMRQPKGRGRYVSVVWLPPHLFNVGRVHVGINLTTPVSGKLIRHAVVDRALSFEIFEVPFGKPSARGDYKELKGVVRPLCQWETEGP